MSIIKKQREKHSKRMLLAKTKLITIEIFISKVSIDSHINHYESVSVNDMPTEYNVSKEEIKNLAKSCRLYHIEIYCVSCKKNTAHKTSIVSRTKQKD